MVVKNELPDLSTAAVRRAQLPAAAWSEHFPDKNACLTAAFDELQTRQVMPGAGTAITGPPRPGAADYLIVATVASGAKS